MKTIYILTSLTILLGCEKNIKGHSDYKLDSQEHVLDKSEITFKSTFTIDTSKVSYLQSLTQIVSNSEIERSIGALCYCEKSVKNNTIKIQIISGIPNQSELDSIGIVDNSGGKIAAFMARDLKDISGQFKFLTIQIKDELIESIELFSKSTEPEYNGQHFKKSETNKYQIAISKMHYSIASDIFGSYNLRLNEDFGYFDNDTVVSGHFLCSNWKVLKEEEIREMKLN
ncbi:hypothetical protein [Gilvibacter sp.]|uniref:hypothetical protein n=1 Tax=Gilvibacter sp. TaxID=2729997 RepID=UPI0025C0004A|nr:hypothetical protein [Gilvibacter sp.]NQX78468.1 hypothetical protein [Gilvibacter sp.]